MISDRIIGFLNNLIIVDSLPIKKIVLITGLVLLTSTVVIVVLPDSDSYNNQTGNDQTENNVSQDIKFTSTVSDESILVESTGSADSSIFELKVKYFEGSESYEFLVSELPSVYKIEKSRNDISSVQILSQRGDLVYEKSVTDEVNNIEEPNLSAIPDRELILGNPISLNSSKYTSLDEDKIKSNIWETGTGFRYNVSSISHTYDEPGTYTATLTIVNLEGESDSREFLVRVNQDKLITDIVAPDVAFVGEEIEFKGDESTSSIVDDIGWIIAGESYSKPNPKVTFNTPGAYNVVLSAQSSLNRRKSISDKIIIRDPPEDN